MIEKMTAEDIGIGLVDWWVDVAMERIRARAYNQETAAMGRHYPPVDWRAIRQEVDTAIRGAVAATRK